MSNSTKFVRNIHLDPPPLHIIFMMQIFGLSANILNHRATRVLFEGDSVAIALANSIISIIMVILICGSIELFITMTNSEVSASEVSTFQGPIFILTAVIMHPILLINNFAEIGYTCGTAVIYKSSFGIILKVLAAFVASIGTKTLLTITNTQEANIETYVYVLSILLAIPGIYLSLTKRKICMKKTSSYQKVPLDFPESEPNTPNKFSAVAIGFAVLATSNAFWTLFQVLFAQQYDINSTGYISLDQVFGSLFTIVVTCVSNPLWTNDRSVKQLMSSVVSRINTCSSALIYLSIAKLISNGMIVVYFVLSTRYDPGLVVLEMALSKVIIGVLYTISVAFCCPKFLAMTQQELDDIKSCDYILKRVVGICFITLALALFA